MVFQADEGQTRFTENFYWRVSYVIFPSELRIMSVMPYEEVRFGGKASN
jgi:hypothetical protein